MKYGRGAKATFGYALPVLLLVVTTALAFFAGGFMVGYSVAMNTLHELFQWPHVGFLLIAWLFYGLIVLGCVASIKYPQG